MSSFKYKNNGVVAVILFMTLLFISFFSNAADRIKCPVCGEIFDNSVKICPNDGTDLKILGKKIKEPVDSDKNAEDFHDTDSRSDDNKSKNKDTDDVIKLDVKTDATESSKKYIRQDRGGKRKRLEESFNDNNNEQRTDRMRRIGDKRAGVEPVKKIEPVKDTSKQDAMNACIRNIYLKNVKNYNLMQSEQKMQSDFKKFYEQNRISLNRGAPLVSLGIRLAFMPEGKSPGRVGGAEIDINFLRRAVRLGLSSFAGNRKVNDRRDFMFVESLSIGVQNMGIISPFVIARFGLGAMLQNRFSENLVYLMRNMAVEGGVDCRFSNGVVFTPSVGFNRYAIKDSGWNNVSLKLSVGF